MRLVLNMPLLLLLLSPVFSFFARSLLVVWGFIEVYGLFFVLYLMKKKLSKWALLIVFLVQCLCSVLIVWGIVVKSYDLFILSLFFKTGLFPFWGWVVALLDHLDIVSAALMFIFLKMIPFVFLVSAPLGSIYIWLCLMTLLAFSLLPFYYSGLKKILFFSSGISTCLFLVLGEWGLAASLSFCGFYFFVVYWTMSEITRSSLISCGDVYFTKNFNVLLSIFTIRGLPLTVGFLPKWFMLRALFGNSVLLLFAVLLISFCFIGLFYLRIGLTRFFLKKIYFVFSPIRGSFFKNSYVLYLISIVIYSYYLVH